MEQAKRYFFCGIGGSGMLPLAMIARARGHDVSGSDRSLDQGRTAAKFDWLAAQGVALFPQDGSGVTGADQTIVASAAIEDSVPDIARAIALGCARITRADLNAALFNAAAARIGIGGTSGKSTVTGMIGWILHRADRAPTVMNGAVMRNFVSADNPYASALAGGGNTYVSEVDESDGSIALYRPTVAVVTNISLDHKSLTELHQLFGDFARVADVAVLNADDAESAALDVPHAVRFGFSPAAEVRAEAVEPLANGMGSIVDLNCHGERARLHLAMPGRHNVANALAAIAATHAAGVPLANAVAALADFAGIARRFEVVGSARGITVIDDFGHNPDKIAATLAALHQGTGRVLAYFQPHGYGPLRLMKDELGAAFAAGLNPGDRLYVSDPAYFGGTVDRSVGSKALVDTIVATGGDAMHLPTRAACGDALIAAARTGDRIVILGARDDTLSDFARDLLARLG